MRATRSRGSEPGHMCQAPPMAMMSRDQGSQQFAPRAITHASTFLHSFAPPALPGFTATMSALTSGRPALRILIRDNERRPYCRPVLPGSRCRTFRPFRLQPPVVVLRPWFGCASQAYRAVGPSPDRIPRGTGASVGLRPLLAGSPRRPAESSSSSYGLVVHLPLLSTCPCGHAVMFGYRVQTQP
jgi:hypothetical protein